MAVDQCMILSNPDVSGVGVRAAIYAQNLACFLPVIVNLWDGKISSDELKGIKDQSIGMLAVAYAILLTTIILAKGSGGGQTITSYHAAVVLDLSWMNNTSTWIWFILYVHYQSKRDKQPIQASWSKWWKTLFEPFKELSGQRERDRDNTGTGMDRYIRRIARRNWRLISGKPVLTLGSIHLSLMAAVGIWLWSDPAKFGKPLDPSCDPTLTVVGVPARFSSKPLRIASLAMYSLVLIPGFNLILPFAFFLGLHLLYNWSREHNKSFWTWWDNALDDALDSIRKVVKPRKSLPSPDPEQGGSSQRSAAASSADAEPDTSASFPNTAPIVSRADTQPGTAPDTEQGRPFQRSTAISIVAAQTERPGTPHTAFLIVGLVLLVIINVLFIVDIELTLRRNKGDQDGDEAAWGFGQVLALLLLVIPLRDAWGALQDTWEKQERVQQQFAESLLRECQATPGIKELQRLIDDGAKPKESLRLAGIIFGNALQLVAYHGTRELVQSLQLEESREPQGIKDTGVQFQTALQSAAARGNLLMVKFLLEDKKYAKRLDEVGGDYGTALCAACVSGKFEVVKALLQAEARRNVAGEQISPRVVQMLSWNQGNSLEAHFTLLY